MPAQYDLPAGRQGVKPDPDKNRGNAQIAPKFRRDHNTCNQLTHPAEDLNQ